MRYLGCKQKIAEKIVEVAGKHEKHVIVDAFTGTGTMAKAFAQSGMIVLACDVLHACCVLAKCRITMKEPLSQDILDQMNDEAMENDGFVFNTYSPSCDRHYFTQKNAKRIDYVRNYIETLDEPSKTHALGCLLEAVSNVSNTTGTFGAWCKNIDPRATKPIKFVDSFSVIQNHSKHIVFHDNAKNVLSREKYDIVYLDPPYNSRQYGANYHVLETISRYDNPIVSGKTGLRDWKDTKSLWCYKSSVKRELTETIKACNCDIIIMSYNNEGIMTKDEICDILKQFGEVNMHTIMFDKYKTKSHKKSNVEEYLFELKKRATSLIPNEIYNFDCITGMRLFAPETIDMILCDPPFGLTECAWDSVIDIPSMFDEFKRIIKPDGAIVVFCQQPFTSKLILNGLDIYKYSLVWKKSKKGNFAQAPYRFMCEHEDIIVFSKGKTAKNGIPRMKYNPQGLVECNKSMKGKTGNTEHRSGRKTQKDYVQTKTGYPSSILEFKNEDGFHPTQKPVALCEYLVKSFSNEGDIVLDSCMGSGTTAIACVQSNRKYIGFETNHDYYKKCMTRLDAHTK